MKRRIITLLIALAVLLGGAFLYFKGKRYEVVISQSQIDSSLAEKFPVTKRHLFIFSATYSNPQVTLLDHDDKIQVGMDVTLKIRLNDEPKDLGGGCTITSNIRYEPETHEFYLDNAQIDRLEIQGIPAKYIDQVTQFVSDEAKAFIESKPIYRMTAKDSKSVAAKMLLKEVDVTEQEIHIYLGI